MATLHFHAKFRIFNLIPIFFQFSKVYNDITATYVVEILQKTLFVR